MGLLDNYSALSKVLSRNGFRREKGIVSKKEPSRTLLKIIEDMKPYICYGDYVQMKQTIIAENKRFDGNSVREFLKNRVATEANQMRQIDHFFDVIAPRITEDN